MFDRLYRSSALAPNHSVEFVQYFFGESEQHFNTYFDIRSSELVRIFISKIFILKYFRKYSSVMFLNISYIESIFNDSEMKLYLLLNTLFIVFF